MKVKKFIYILLLAALLAACKKPNDLPKQVEVKYTVIAHAKWAIMTYNDPLWHTADSISLDSPWSNTWSGTVEPDGELVLICSGYAFDTTATWVEVTMEVNNQQVLYTLDHWWPADTLRQFGGTVRVPYSDI